MQLKRLTHAHEIYLKKAKYPHTRISFEVYPSFFSQKNNNNNKKQQKNGIPVTTTCLFDAIFVTLIVRHYIVLTCFDCFDNIFFRGPYRYF